MHRPALGNAGGNVLRRGTTAPGSGHVGVAGDHAVVVAAGIAHTGGGASAGHPGADRVVGRHRHSGGDAGSAGCGRKDPAHVVIDEVAGQLVTLIAAPITWKTILAGFILFRGFDIVKPPPVRS